MDNAQSTISKATNGTGNKETVKARPCVHVRMIGEVYRFKPVAVPPPVVNLSHWVEALPDGLFETIILTGQTNRR